LRFIRAKAAKQILVGDVAEHVGVSRRVLERRFMESLQYSPGAEIRQCRLRHARRLLERTQLQVHAVAERSGFGSAEYMAWVFKRELAVTPLQYRRAYSRKTG
jgi:LacI family transcriptional regulator